MRQSSFWVDSNLVDLALSARAIEREIVWLAVKRFAFCGAAEVFTFWQDHKLIVGINWIHSSFS